MTRAVADADAASRLLERTRVYVEAETPSGDVARGRFLARGAGPLWSVRGRIAGARSTDGPC